jgi:hypothetical protein
MDEQGWGSCLVLAGAGLSPIVVAPFAMLATLGFQPVWLSIIAGLLLVSYGSWYTTVIRRFKR